MVAGVSWSAAPASCDGTTGTVCADPLLTVIRSGEPASVQRTAPVFVTVNRNSPAPVAGVSAADRWSELQSAAVARTVGETLTDAVGVPGGLGCGAPESVACSASGSATVAT